MNTLPILSQETTMIPVQHFGTIKKGFFPCVIIKEEIKGTISEERRIGPSDRRTNQARIGGRRKNDVSDFANSNSVPEDITSILMQYPGSIFVIGNSFNQHIKIKSSPNCPGSYLIKGTIEEIRGAIECVIEIIEGKKSKSINPYLTEYQ